MQGRCIESCQEALPNGALACPDRVVRLRSWCMPGLDATTGETGEGSERPRRIAEKLWNRVN
jgi:hypothetical protein